MNIFINYAHIIKHYNLVSVHVIEHCNTSGNTKGEQK